MPASPVLELRRILHGTSLVPSHYPAPPCSLQVSMRAFHLARRHSGRCKICQTSRKVKWTHISFLKRKREEGYSKDG